MSEITATEPLPDVQSQSDSRDRMIQKVGVSDIRYPFRFKSQDSSQETIGNWSMLVSLEAQKRGTHMSRFMEMLSKLDGVQSIASLQDFGEEMLSRLATDDTFVEVQFPWFIEKAGPVSEKRGKLDIDVKLRISRGTENDCVVSLYVPATSLCPCSKMISDFGAHNQRCIIEIEARFFDGKEISLDELIQIAEDAASAPVYSVIKRDDEKWVTERAFENPKFVEDIVRDLATALHNESRISWYRCASTNFESIHNHNAYAEIVFDRRK